MRPLSGITILDLTRLLPGAYATLLLADLGADVVKVEDPRLGDPVRLMPPFAGGVSVYFQALNRDKRSITLDLSRPEAREVLDALVSRADVLVESFRPRTARRLGISAADLSARHPRLVHCSITGFGQTGPYADRAGHDLNYVALAGLLAIDRPAADQAPRMPRMFIADIGGGALNAVAGILAALFARERTGRGVAVDVSMHEGALSWLTFPAARALVEGGDIDPSDLPISGREACYNVYRTADGEYVALGALEPKFWAAFCERIGRLDLIPLQYAAGDEQARARAEVAGILRSRPRSEWLALFEDVDACFTAVNSVADALADPHVAARGAVLRRGGSRFIRAPLLVHQPAEETGGPDRAVVTVRSAPLLGADTDSVLAAAGFDDQARAALRASGAI